jgi:hypothetical protein
MRGAPSRPNLSWVSPFRFWSRKCRVLLWRSRGFWNPADLSRDLSLASSLGRRRSVREAGLAQGQLGFHAAPKPGPTLHERYYPHLKMRLRFLICLNVTVLWSPRSDGGARRRPRQVNTGRRFFQPAGMGGSCTKLLVLQEQKLSGRGTCFGGFGLLAVWWLKGCGCYYIGL